MKIVVPIKSVGTLDDDFELREDGRGADPGSLDWSLNEWDDFSVEAALQLREHAGGEVVVITVGDDDAEDGLLACLAKGADRAVRVWDEALDGADPLAIACVLHAAVAREDAQLVLCGAQSSDGVNSATGIALAGRLGVPHVAVVSSLELDPSGTRLRVGRELEGGLVEELALGLPALLTIQTGINEPRYANLRAIKQAREKPMDELGLTDLGLTADDVESAAGAHVRRAAPPAAAEGAQMLEGSAAEVASRIADLIRERVTA